ncbi:hypothetical protein CBW65_12160 [Tumebacillus avium]|uniref:HTH cro/C1-type domain-containing protein n=1 Tax=Tumebacillus avium TaxID=1903704 RepID=A0A1Y0IN64_9BACL|nr:helix-turn-helix transcriptional regulator [Tumebacillus avium]ARU61690.1 hypothetical protein CBW65_12160 [Tumebacillus avium]
MNLDQNTSETIGTGIRRLRNLRSMSQSQLADRVGVTFGWISQIEQDKAIPSAELLSKIATQFKIPVHELIQNEESHMELKSRIKLVEVLLEAGQPEEAEMMISGLEPQPDLSDSDRLTIQIHLAECKYQQKDYDQSIEILRPLIHS